MYAETLKVHLVTAMALSARGDLAKCHRCLLSSIEQTSKHPDLYCGNKGKVLIELIDPGDNEDCLGP